MIDFSGGSLFIQRPNEEPIPLANNVTGTMECELSADVDAPVLYNSKDMDFTFEGFVNNLELFDYVFNMPLFSNGFTIEHNIPIMIQVRWHKKPRICKKWLKRYGMKSDVARVKMKATTVEYDAYNGDFSFEVNGGREYVLRPDQKRRGIKIEW